MPHGPASLIFCAIGICTCYIYYGILQERYFSGEKRIGANFALVSQTFTNSLVALIWGRLANIFTTTGDWGLSKKSYKPSSKSSKQVLGLDHPLLMFTSFCYIAAMSTSNYSFQYVSYPVAVLAKSCKLIPTMVVSLIVERKRYSVQEWLAAACICGGIVLFNLSRTTSKSGMGDQSKDSSHGIFLLLVSLCFDGFLGSCQGLLQRADRLGSKRPPTPMETMFFVNIYSLIVLVPMAVHSGEWDNGISRLDEIKEGLFLLNAAAASGQIFIFLTLAWFSPLICTTITTTRKFFTILLSVIHFGHVFSWVQWSAISLVFGGLYIGIVSKARGGGRNDKVKAA